MTILLFLAVLFVLILVHELGHFVVAKWTGMRVDEFGIGFPPKLFGVQRGETEYTLNLLPIGGFVKIFGENYEDEGTPDPRAFANKRRVAQAAVLIAGVTMNILFAWFLITAVLVGGVPTAVDADSASEDASLVVAELLPESPAASAKVPLGAHIVAVTAGEQMLSERTPEAFAAFMAAHENEEIALTYEHGGEEVTATMRPYAGVIEGSDRAAIGVAVSLVDVVHYPIHRAAIEAAKMTWRSLAAITIGIGTLFVDTVTFSADFSQVAGPIGIVNLVGDAADFGWASLLMFSAVISLNLAVINLLPVPALDGGRLLFVAIEAVRRKPLNPIWTGRANLIGFAFLILLMVAVTVGDITRLL